MLHLAPGPSEGEDSGNGDAADSICIEVLSLGGEPIASVAVQPGDTVETLVQILQLDLGVRVRLLFEGRELEDTSTVAGAGLQNKDQVIAVIYTRRFAGGQAAGIDAPGARGVFLFGNRECEVYILKERVVNRRDDKEFDMEFMWGTWSGDEENGLELEVEEHELKLVDESRTPCLRSITRRSAYRLSMRLSCRTGQIHVLGDDIDDHKWSLVTLNELKGDEHCVFDSWHDAGTAVDP